MAKGPRGGWRRRPAARAAGAILLAATFFVQTGVAHAAPPLAAVGTLPLGVNDRLVVDARTHHLISIGGGEGIPGQVFLKLTVFDGDKLTRLRKADYPPLRPQFPRVYAFDERRRLLYLVAYASDEEQSVAVNPRLISVNVDSLKIVRNTALTVFPPGMRVLGAGLSAEGKLVLAAEPNPVPYIPPGPGVAIAAVDPATGRVLRGPEVVRGCQSLIGTEDQAAVAVVRKTIFVGCATAFLVVGSAPGVPAVVAIDMVRSTDQKVYFLPGTYAPGESYFDPPGGRLLLVGTAPGRPAQAVWVFDIRHRAFVGEVAAGDLTVYRAGVDPATGRLYVTATGELLVGSDRGLDIPQAQAFPVHVWDAPITPIPFNKTVVVPVTAGKDHFLFRVYRDHIPNSAISPGRPIDYRSYDAVRTATLQFEGDVQAFGFRVHQLGGFNGMLLNVVPVLPGGDYWAPVRDVTGLNDGDRDLYFARVQGAYLSRDEATGSSISVDRDANTDQDYNTATRNAPGAASPKWPFTPAQCSDFGAGRTQRTEEGAAARCNGTGDATAGASYAGVGMPGVVSVGSSSSVGDVRLDPKLGLVAEARAEAREVTIGDAVHIGRISSLVRVLAFGRSGTTKAKYTRSFENVSAGGFGCTTDCDPSSVLRAISSALGTQFQVEFPRAEIEATPGGTHAHAFRETWQHEQDVVINNQDPTELQVPALRVIYIGDNSVASRAIFEFAATKADVTYHRGSGTPSAPTVSRARAAASSGILGVTHRPGSPSGIQPGTAVQVGGRVGRRIQHVLGHGWKLLFGGGVRSIAVWAMLVAPAFLALRRRELLRLLRARQ